MLPGECLFGEFVGSLLPCECLVGLLMSFLFRRQCVGGLLMLFEQICEGILCNMVHFHSVYWLSSNSLFHW